MTKDYPRMNELSAFAIQAGGIMRKALSSSDLEVKWKSDMNIVNNTRLLLQSPAGKADREVNDCFIRWVKVFYPHIAVIGEEASYIPEGWSPLDEDAYWIIVDPIDGSAQYLNGLSVWSFCCAVRRGQRTLVSLVYDPIMGRTWAAEKGRGAFLNGKRIHVSDRSFDRSLSHMLWWEGAIGNLRKVQSMVEKKGGTTLQLWSVAIPGALVASGNMVASSFGWWTSWESAALDLMVKEAGGEASDLKGGPLKHELALEKDGSLRYPIEIKPIDGSLVTNGVVHDEHLRMIAEANKPSPWRWLVSKITTWL